MKKKLLKVEIHHYEHNVVFSTFRLQKFIKYLHEFCQRFVRTTKSTTFQFVYIIKTKFQNKKEDDILIEALIIYI